MTRAQIGQLASVLGVVASVALACRPARGDDAPSITNDLGMKLVLVPAGEFVMGSPDTDKECSER